MSFTILSQIEEARKILGREPLPIELPIHDSCSCNKCPIDSNYKKMKVAEGDFQKKCSLPKRIRKIIGEYYHLENKGLCERELLGEKKWAEMPEEKKQAQGEIMRFALAKSKQGTPGRKNKDTPKIALAKEPISPKSKGKKGIVSEVQEVASI